MTPDDSRPFFSADVGALLVWACAVATVVIITIVSMKGFKRSVEGGAHPVEARSGTYRTIYLTAGLGAVVCTAVWLFRTQIFYDLFGLAEA